MIAKLFFLFGVVPLVELALLMILADQTHWGYSIALVIVTGVAGSALARAQDHAQDAELELPTLRHGTPVFIDGISLGPMVERVFDATASIGLNQSLPVFLVDEELSHLAAWLHVVDRSKQLADERFFVFCGAGALQALAEFLEGHDDLASAPCCAITPPGFAVLREKLLSLHVGVLLRRENAYQEIVRQLTERYARCNQAWAAQRRPRLRR